MIGMWPLFGALNDHVGDVVNNHSTRTTNVGRVGAEPCAILSELVEHMLLG